MRREALLIDNVDQEEHIRKKNEHGSFVTGPGYSSAAARSMLNISEEAACIRVIA